MKILAQKLQNKEEKEYKCPCCGKETDKVHDYREQTIKDAPVFGEVLLIHLKRRRYRCSCGKRFYEKNESVHRYQRMTHRLKEYVVEKLRKERSFTSVARDVGISVSIVIRIFDVISYSMEATKNAVHRRIQGQHRWRKISVHTCRSRE